MSGDALWLGIESRRTRNYDIKDRDATLTDRFSQFHRHRHKDRHHHAQ